ncbi:hypothetical protein O9929_01890 [Vibrio lentus]|nr:hypothetical protein [Vibrio lentus]
MVKTTTLDARGCQSLSLGLSRISPQWDLEQARTESRSGIITEIGPLTAGLSRICTATRQISGTKSCRHRALSLCDQRFFRCALLSR